MDSSHCVLSHRFGSGVVNAPPDSLLTHVRRPRLEGQNGLRGAATSIDIICGSPADPRGVVQVVSRPQWNVSPIMDAPLNKVDTTYKIDDLSDAKPASSEAKPAPQDDSPSMQAPEKLFPDNHE
jgi:hypothetical protein